MIYDEDSFRRRPRKLTARKTVGEVRLNGGKYGKMASGHGQLTKIRLSDGCGGKTITTAAQFEYDRHGFEGYLGNVG